MQTRQLPVYYETRENRPSQSKESNSGLVAQRDLSPWVIDAPRQLALTNLANSIWFYTETDDLNGPY